MTDRRRFGEGRFYSVIEAAIVGGVEMLQLREKDLTEADLLPLALELRGLTEGKAQLFINGSLRTAIESEADGLHLPDGLLASTAAPLVEEAHRRGMTVGVSVHDEAGARRAEAWGADYLQAGHVFATASHPGEPPRGVEFLKSLRAAVGLSLIAIGGIDAGNAGGCIRAGADGVAVISAIGCADDPFEAALGIRTALDRAWNEAAKER